MKILNPLQAVVLLCAVSCPAFAADVDYQTISAAAQKTGADYDIWGRGALANHADRFALLHALHGGGGVIPGRDPDITLLGGKRYNT